MGQLITLMESPHLADGCAVAKNAAAALIANGWKGPANIETQLEVSVAVVLSSNQQVDTLGAENDLGFTGNER